MKESRDQALLSFALGELPFLPRLLMRVRLALNPADRRRLRSFQESSEAVAGVLASSGSLGFLANLAVKQRRLIMIDLFVGFALACALAASGIYTWTRVGAESADDGAVPSCPTPVSTSGGPVTATPHVGGPMLSPRPKAK